MVSVARATLVFEWRRFLPAVLAVAFSGLLVLIQLALLLGMFGTVMPPAGLCRVAGSSHALSA